MDFLVGEFRFICYPYRVRESLSGCGVSVAACLAVALALVGLAVQVESQGSLWTEVDTMLFILLVGVALDSTEPAQGLSQHCSKIFLVWIGRRLRVPPPTTDMQSQLFEERALQSLPDRSNSLEKPYPHRSKHPGG